MKVELLGKTPEELREIVENEGLPRYAATQVAEWVYGRKVSEIGLMTNVSKAGRERLSANCTVGARAWIDRQVSADGTVKYLFPVECDVAGRTERGAVEAVVIPDGDRATLCVSSQAGCRMGCAFCMTGRQGFHGNLSVADILSQFVSIEERDRLTNAVFMGMGEPLDNYDNVMRAMTVLTSDWGFGWSPKRVTLSTVGVLPALEHYLDECKCHLAISLHDPFAEERLSLMPVQKAWPIEKVIAIVKRHDFTGQRRVSFEYTMFSGFNDTMRHADALARLLAGLECRVNLIRFHKIPGFPFSASAAPVMEAFRERLNRVGITTTIRVSRGEDILAACGLLAGGHASRGGA